MHVPKTTVSPAKGNPVTESVLVAFISVTPPAKVMTGIVPFTAAVPFAKVMLGMVEAGTFATVSFSLSVATAKTIKGKI